MSHHLEQGGLGWGYILHYSSKPLGGASHPQEAAPSAYPWVGFPRAKCLEANHCSKVPLSFNDQPAENSSKNKVRFFFETQKESKAIERKRNIWPSLNSETFRAEI